MFPRLRTAAPYRIGSVTLPKAGTTRTVADDAGAVRRWCATGVIDSVRIDLSRRIPRASLGKWATIITEPAAPPRAPDARLDEHDPPLVITTREAAEASGVNRSTVSVWCRAGKLASIHNGPRGGATRIIADKQYDAFPTRHQRRRCG